jgi:hypothetical protein
VLRLVCCHFKKADRSVYQPSLARLSDELACRQDGTRHVRNLASGTVLSEQPDGSQTVASPARTVPALQRLAGTPQSSSEMLRAGSVDSLGEWIRVLLGSQ